MVAAWVGVDTDTGRSRLEARVGWWVAGVMGAYRYRCPAENTAVLAYLMAMSRNNCGDNELRDKL
jgi:hypothetical protein